jgi:hypothetical protein
VDWHDRGVLSVDPDTVKKSRKRASTFDVHEGAALIREPVRLVSNIGFVAQDLWHRSSYTVMY